MISGSPMFLHAQPREFVVLRARRVRQSPIDEVHDGDMPLALGERRGPPVIRIVAQLCGQLAQEPPQCGADILELRGAGGIESRLARILNIFAALEHFVEILRQIAARAEEVDLHDQGIYPR